MDQFYELLRFFSGDFVDLRLFFFFFFSPAGEKMAGNGTRSDNNKGHAHSFARTVRLRSFYGPTKRNVSGSVAVSVSVHMEPCTIYFYFLDFYRSRFRIRIAPVSFSVSVQMDSHL